MQSRSPDASFIFVAVSPYDLNEFSLCDFRANIVPLNRTVQDLTQSDVDWQFSKSVLGQYPVMLVRQLFPTVGRSDGVVVGIRANLLKLAGGSADAGEAPKLADTGKSDIKERLSDWSGGSNATAAAPVARGSAGEAFVQRSQKLALMRLLLQAEQQGAVVLLVLPNAPALRPAILSDAAMQEFEQELADLRKRHPQIPMIRVDQLADLDHNEYYYDPVHLNMYGQEIATESLLTQLKELSLRTGLFARGEKSR